MSGIIRFVDILGADVTHRQATPLAYDMVTVVTCSICGATGRLTGSQPMPPVWAYCDHGAKPKAPVLDDGDADTIEQNEVKT